MRNVIILNTKGTTPRLQGVTAATTLGELAAQFNLSIDFNSQRVVEAKSNTILPSYESQLPVSVVDAAGNVTTDLTIFIQPTKKIDSGGLSPVRETLYRAVKDLEEMLKKENISFNKLPNITNASNVELSNYAEYMEELLKEEESKDAMISAHVEDVWEDRNRSIKLSIEVTIPKNYIPSTNSIEEEPVKDLNSIPDSQLTDEELIKKYFNK